MMNDIMLHKVNFNSKTRRYVPLKSDKRLVTSERKSLKNSFEIRPLISVDTDSCSDDEVTLHDIRHLKRVNDGPDDNFSLRKVKKSVDPVKNGKVSEKTNVSDPFQNCEFLNLEVEKGESLQSISIKYHCSISDIKRANNLISDQDFYALKYIKIPVKKYGLLTEILSPVTDSKAESVTIVEDAQDNCRIINVGIGRIGRSPSPQETATFFKRMDEDLVKIMLSTQTQKESLEAATVALTAPQIQPLVKDPYNTVDCGIQWNYLLIFVICLALVIPAAMAVYMYMRTSNVQHQDVYPSSSPAFSPGKLSEKSKS